MRDFHWELVARIPGLKSETWGTLRLVPDASFDHVSRSATIVGRESRKSGSEPISASATRHSC
jgi:hypothetical protein